MEITRGLPHEKPDQITDYLYLGGFASAANATPDKIQAILSVINFPFPDKDKKYGIEYKTIQAIDCSETDLLTRFPETNQWIGERVDAKRSVLVHCQAGVSRSSTIVCAYIMQKLNKNAAEAIAFVRLRRRWAAPNHGFVAQLELFHRMGYTLNANERLFRNFLVEIHFGIDKNIQLIDKYFQRLTAIERQTKVLELGREYRCQKCSFTAFHEINIVRNIDPKDKGQCSDIYVEPLEWMKDQFKSIPLYRQEGRIKCKSCSTCLGSYRQNFVSYRLECYCPVHKGLNRTVKIKVFADAVKIYDPNEESIDLAQNLSRRLSLGSPKRKSF